MTDRQFTPEDAILVAKAAGLDVSDLQRQQRRSEEGTELLLARIKRLEQQLEGSQPQEAQRSPPSIADQERQFAEGLRAALPDPGWIDYGSVSAGNQDG